MEGVRRAICLEIRAVNYKLVQYTCGRQFFHYNFSRKQLAAIKLSDSSLQFYFILKVTSYESFHVVYGKWRFPIHLQV